jgi:hypothetical protein
MRLKELLKKEQFNKHLQMAQADYQDIQQLLNVGQTAEDYQRQALESDIARFEFEENKPYTKLQSYLSAAYGAPMGQVSTTDIIRRR